MDQQVGARGDVPGRLGPVRGPGRPLWRQGAGSGPCAWAGPVELVTHGRGGAARAAALGLDGLGASQGAATAPEPGARAGAGTPGLDGLGTPQDAATAAPELLVKTGLFCQRDSQPECPTLT